MNTSRRSFMAGAIAFAAWPGAAFAAKNPAKNPAKGGARKRGPAGSRRFSPWEKPDGSATDSVMVRRLHLDLAGRIPTREEAMAYVYSANPNKLESLVERLLASDDFANFWTMRFCDIMRVKSEFPINLWPNAVYVYHARIRKFVAGNEPWDAFGRALVTSQGSDFRDPEVNFFRATDTRTPEGWADAAAYMFLGIEPGDPAGAESKKTIAEYFANVKIKNTREWKEEIVFADGPDRRGELCEMLFRDRQGEVAAAFGARIRKWIYGIDAAAGKCNGGELRLKDALRGIVLSPDYARGSITGGFPARRIEAETLDDAFRTLSGSKRNYQSPAPEPFTFLPPDRSTVSIEDGSISNGFLTLFGRPPRDTGLMDERGNDVTAKQRLNLFNSGNLARQLRIISQPPRKLPDGSINPESQLPVHKRIDRLYWCMLSRAPSPEERNFIIGLKQKRSAAGKTARLGELLYDVAWCLANSKEFIFRI